MFLCVIGGGYCFFFYVLLVPLEMQIGLAQPVYCIVSKISTMSLCVMGGVQHQNVCNLPNSQQFDECRLNFTRWFTYFLLHIEFQLEFCISQNIVVCHLLHILFNAPDIPIEFGIKCGTSRNTVSNGHPKFIERVFS